MWNMISELYLYNMINDPCHLLPVIYIYMCTVCIPGKQDDCIYNFSILKDIGTHVELCIS